MRHPFDEDGLASVEEGLVYANALEEATGVPAGGLGVLAVSGYMMLGSRAVDGGDVVAGIPLLARACALVDEADSGSIAVGVHTRLGAALLAVGDTSAALRVLEEAVTVADRTGTPAGNARSYLGRACMVAGDPRGALDALIPALHGSGDRERSIVLRSIAAAHLELGELPAALQAAQGACDAAGPGSAELAGALNNLAGVQEAMGDVAAARESVMASRALHLSIDPGTDAALANLAYARQLVGDVQ